MDPNTKFLSDKEIDEFVTELDTDNDGVIKYHEVEQKLDEISRHLSE